MNTLVLRRHGSAPLRPSVVAIGNFDGVHLGHQALLEQLNDLSQALQASPTVLLFYPHPRQLFQPNQAPRMVMSLSEKLHSLHQYGVAQVILRRFHPAYAALSAEAFIQQELVDSLQAKAVLVGDDFRFGQKRSGSITTLQAAKSRYGFETVIAPEREYQRRRISSTWLREVIVQGDMRLYQALTGRSPCFEGVVVHGAMQGRKWNMPTVNIPMRYNPGWSGIFSGYVHHGNKLTKAAISLGYRPFVGGGERLLEAHLLDFDGDLYGHHLKVTLVEKIRDQQQFSQHEALMAAMQADLLAVRRSLLS